MFAVTVHDIIKTYGAAREKVTALNKVSFQIEEGALFGLIGPDGAGKSSLFRILTTLLLADSGEATVDGLDVVKDLKAIRRRVGYMPGRFSLYPDLSVEENLEFFATIFSTTVRENYDLIKDIYVQIEPFRKRRAGKLSGGMKQKLALCCALIHRPRVLFLDEPTTGVDAVSRKEFWEMLRTLRKEGITILVSTPYMDEAGLCDRVALIQKGTIMTIDTPENITESYSRRLLAVRATEMNRLLTALEKFPGKSKVYPSGIYHHLVVDHDVAAGQVTAWLEEKGFLDIECKQIKPSIEDCFMELMQ